MSEHTKGKLIQHPESGGQIGLYASGHGYVAFVPLGSFEHFIYAQRANARRVLACWNACDGISTETLQDFKLDDIEAHALERVQTLEDERDELVKALRDMTWFHAGTDDAGLPGLANARAILAKHDQVKP